MWGPMLKAALAMGVGPEAFWRLSLKEWRMLTAPASDGAPMDRAGFEALAARWPDRANG